MTQQEADKLLELYRKGYEIYLFRDIPCELYDDGSFYGADFGSEEGLIYYDTCDFTVNKPIPDWTKL